MQFSTGIRNGRLDLIESMIGVAARLIIYSGTMPVNCAASETGTALARIDLPADWMNAASGGVKTKNGTWSDGSSDAGGVATHFRIVDQATELVCGCQGTTAAAAGPGVDMVLDTVTFVSTQPFSVLTFTLNENNG